jgi:RNA recognition motif-containing protein
VVKLCLAKSRPAKTGSRAVIYVQFKNEEDANQAMADLKDASMNGRPLTIEPFGSQPAAAARGNCRECLHQNVASAQLHVCEGRDGTALYFGFYNVGGHEEVREAKLNDMSNALARPLVSAPAKIVVQRGAESSLELMGDRVYPRRSEGCRVRADSGRFAAWDDC